MVYCICLYDEEGVFLSKRCFSCKGCAKKRMPRNTPACLRLGGKDGEILSMNAPFKKIKGKVQKMIDDEMRGV